MQTIYKSTVRLTLDEHSRIEHSLPRIKALQNGQKVYHHSKNHSLRYERMVKYAQDGKVCSAHANTEQGDGGTEEAFTGRLSRESSDRDYNAGYKAKTIEG